MRALSRAHAPPYADPLDHRVGAEPDPARSHVGRRSQSRPAPPMTTRPPRRTSLPPRPTPSPQLATWPRSAPTWPWPTSACRSSAVTASQAAEAYNGSRWAADEARAAAADADDAAAVARADLETSRQAYADALVDSYQYSPELTGLRRPGGGRRHPDRARHHRHHAGHRARARQQVRLLRGRLHAGRRRRPPGEPTRWRRPRSSRPRPPPPATTPLPPRSSRAPRPSASRARRPT